MRTPAAFLPTRFLVAALGATLIALPAAATAQGSTAKAARAATAAPALDDPTIVAIFDAANSWDIETGQLAASRGTTAAVRDFGRMLARDHRQVRQMGRDLAKKLGVTPTAPKDFAMAADHQAAMKKLRSVKGAAFDRAFLEHEVAFHGAVIDAINATLLPALKNAEVRKLVTDVAPAFKAHQEAARHMLEQGK
jgi:putative membrane protein